MIKIFLKAGLDVNEPLQSNVPGLPDEPPLYHAILDGQLECVRTFIEAGAELNKPFKDNSTPLYLAILRTGGDPPNEGAKVGLALYIKALFATAMSL